ncbi:MAG: hypothetical protein AAF707_02885 [Pseudomonadota bacterium]
MAIVPSTYDEWEHCITVKCGIELTPDYVSKRIAGLEDQSDFFTRKFIDLWGAEHHDRTLGWFREAKRRLEA